MAQVHKQLNLPHEWIVHCRWSLTGCIGASNSCRRAMIRRRCPAVPAASSIATTTLTYENERKLAQPLTDTFRHLPATASDRQGTAASQPEGWRQHLPGDHFSSDWHLLSPYQYVILLSRGNTDTHFHLDVNLFNCQMTFGLAWPQDHSQDLALDATT